MNNLVVSVNGINLCLEFLGIKYRQLFTDIFTPFNSFKLSDSVN